MSYSTSFTSTFKLNYGITLRDFPQKLSPTSFSTSHRSNRLEGNSCDVTASLTIAEWDKCARNSNPLLLLKTRLFGRYVLLIDLSRCVCVHKFSQAVCSRWWKEKRL